MRLKKHLMLLLFLAVQSLFAKELCFRHIITNTEHSQSSAISIYQDQRGWIWFGNNNLNVYDGRTIRSFRLSSFLDDVPGNNIHMICGDQKSYLYFLANRELIALNIRTEEFKKTGINARALFFDQHHLYYASDNKLYQYHENGTSVMRVTIPNPEASIRAIYEHGGKWFLGSTRGLYIYEHDEIKLILPNENISCIFVDKDEQLWVGTSFNGVRMHDKKNWHYYNAEDSSNSLTGDRVRCINQDENGNIWIGTFSGLTLIDLVSNKSHHFSHNELEPWTLRHSSVYDIIRDQQGGMWVGTYYGGISYFNPDTEKFVYYNNSANDPEKLNGFLFGNMTEDTAGNVYVATEGGGLNMINKLTKKVTRFDKISEWMSNSTAKSVCFDKDYNQLYIGTFTNALLVYSPQTGTFKSIGEHIFLSANQHIITHLFLWSDQLIIITQEGIFCMDRKTQQFSPLFEQADLQKQTGLIYNSAYLDNKDRLWLSATSDTIGYIDLARGEVKKTTDIQEVIGTNSVLHIDSDNHNEHLYISIDGKGILNYDIHTGSSVWYNQENGYLITNDIYKAIRLKSNWLLATSSQGLTLVDIQNKTHTYIRLKDYSPLEYLNANCGVHLSDNGDIFIGGIEGMISVKEEGLHLKEYPYNLRLSSLTVNNEPVTPSAKSQLLSESISYTTRLVLPHNKNNITVGFSSTDYRNMNSYQFEYKLEGHDKQWTRTPYRTVTYTALTPGQYQLIIREAGNEGKGESVFLDLHIKPPFYSSFYAISLYVFLLLFFVVWLIRFYRSRSKLKASLDVEQREKQQLKELNQIKLSFYVNISHELRTPLTLMISQLEQTLQDVNLTAGFKKNLKKIKRHTDQMLQLITEVLDFRRMELNKMPFNASYQDIVAFIRDIYNAFEDYADYKNIRFHFYGADEKVMMWFDTSQLQKAIYNLLSNAFKFTPDKGEVTISLHQKNSSFEISIIDSGYGIAPNEVEAIFDRFYQSEKNNISSDSGTGIGLALTREIILQHQGNIRVDSEIGKGTTFTISLPLGDTHLLPEQKTSAIHTTNKVFIHPEMQKAEETALPDIPDLPIERKEKISVLILEDNDELNKLLRDAFAPIYSVRTARDGVEGLQLCEEYLPDLIISDIMMPRMSGTEFCRQLKQRLETSHIPIILLTARADLESAKEGLRCGAIDYLIKPFSMEILLLKCNNIIKNQLETKRRFTSEIQVRPVELATNKIDQELLDDSVRIIEENLENPDFNIDMWCREIAIGRTRLGSKIKYLSGLTLNDFILQVKLRKCAELLLNKEFTISEVSWMSGFSSPGYMGKCFKEHFGMTPLQYRNKNT